MRFHHGFWSLVPLVSACSTVPPPPVGAGITITLSEQTPLALVYEIIWDEGGGSLAHAGLVVPRDPTPGPGIVYFHQLGRNRNFTQFLEEAKAATTRGVRSVLIDGKYPWMRQWDGDESDVKKIEDQMRRVRLAVELLVSLPVDRQRLGFVGHDYGAMYGALLSTEETPLTRFVFLAPAPTWVSWLVFSQRDPYKVAAYPEFTSSLDPLPRVRTRPEVARFVQFAKVDRYLTTTEQQAWFDAGSGTTVRIVDGSNHEDLPDDGAAERMAWLYAGWGLEPPLTP